MKNILLLGGTGFLGKSLLTELEQKNSVKLMIHNSDLQTHAKKFHGDILSKNSFVNEICDEQIIVNFLGQITSKESDFIDFNIIGALNLLNSCIDKKIKHIILISTINVYGENLERPSKETDSLNPQTTYGIVKMITEKIYKQYSEIYGMNITVLRLADVYGPSKKNGFLIRLINSINNKDELPVCYNNGNQQRDMLYIDDAINCILNVINNLNNGFNCFNVSSSKRYSINDLISKIEKISNSNITVTYTSEVPDEKCIWADNEKAKKFLKFEPKFEIETGLKLTIDNRKK